MGNSYVSVLRIKEIKLLFLSTCIFQTGCYMTYDLNDMIKTSVDEITSRRSFIFGSTIAFCTLGITTDLALKGKNLYLLLISLTLLEIVFLFVIVVL